MISGAACAVVAPTQSLVGALQRWCSHCTALHALVHAALHGRSIAVPSIAKLNRLRCLDAGMHVCKQRHVYGAARPPFLLLPTL